MSPDSLCSDKHGSITKHAGLQALAVIQLGSGSSMEIWSASRNSDSEALIFPCSTAGTKANSPTYCHFHCDAHLLSNNPPLSALTGALMFDSTQYLSQGTTQEEFSTLIFWYPSWSEETRQQESELRGERCRYYRKIIFFFYDRSSLL